MAKYPTVAVNLNEYQGVDGGKKERAGEVWRRYGKRKEGVQTRLVWKQKQPQEVFARQSYNF